MVAYSFKQRFVAPILSGAKCQTIRANRKRHARGGETLQLYTAMRTKQCWLIGRAMAADDPWPVKIDLAADRVVLISDIVSSGHALDRFARRDGFENWEAMRAFWLETHGAIEIFTGVLITWRDLIPARSRVAREAYEAS